MTIDTAIRKQKDKLISKAKKSGLYENFGSKEVNDLKNKFLTGDFRTDMAIQNKINEFFNWAINYAN
jgi:histidinol phosphatase-like enzyme